MANCSESSVVLAVSVVENIVVSCDLFTPVSLLLDDMLDAFKERFKSLFGVGGCALLVDVVSFILLSCMCCP